jgi:hypothetical protein
MSANIADQTAQNVSQAFKCYKWYNSSSLPFEVQCGLSRLELPSDVKVNTVVVPNDIYFTAYIVCNQLPMHETPVSTQYCFVDEFRNTLVWDYILSFPVKTRDLSLDSLLVLTAWTPSGKVFGGTTMNFFDENGSLKRGKQKLMFYFDMKGDGNVIPKRNKTPGELYDQYLKWDYKFKMEKIFETYKSNLATMHAAKQENKVEWLDRLLLTRIQETLGNGSNQSAEEADDGWGCSMEELDLLSFTFLVIEMPMLHNPVQSLIQHQRHIDCNCFSLFARFYMKRSNTPR